MRIDQILLETFVNLLPADSVKKEKYKEEVFKMLQKTYETVGGMHGNGFETPDDMVTKIPFWKLKLRSGKITAGSMYKDKGGRKKVAVFHDQSDQGKADMFDLVVDDLRLNRSFVELSKGALAVLKKKKGSDFLKQYAIPVDSVKKVMDERIDPVDDEDPEVLKHPELKDFFYRREIGGNMDTKIMLGTTGKEIV